MSPDDKNFMKKIISLEKNLEQVNLMYHQVVTQKSVLKIENQVIIYLKLNEIKFLSSNYFRVYFYHLQIKKGS